MTEQSLAGVTDVQPTYYRHRNDDTFRHEIVVRAWQPGVGDLWGLTVTDEDGIDPAVAVHVRTDQFAVYELFPCFWRALAEQKPASLGEVAALLNGLGIADDTAGVERRRAQTLAAWVPDDDSWPHL